MSSDATTAEMPRVIPRKAPAPEGWAIPALLHQTFKTVALPPRMREAALSWSERNPAFEYRYHDNEACRALLAEHFDADTLAAYDKLGYGAFRADLWRYCQLYVTGGVYADIDTVCRADLTRILGPEDRFVAPATGNLPYGVFNAFICAAPGHPFLAAAIARAVRLIHEAPQEVADGYMVTGPGNLGMAINGVLGRPEQAAHLPGRHGQGGRAYRILDKRPDAEGVRMVFDGETPVFAAKYDGYLDDLSSAGIAHWAGARPSVARRVRRMARTVLAGLRG